MFILRASHSLALAGLELLPQPPKNFGLLLPDTDHQAWFQAADFSSLSLVHQWLSEDVQYIVAEVRRDHQPGHVVCNMLKGALPPTLLTCFPSPWYQHLLWLRMSFFFFPGPQIRCVYSNHHGDRLGRPESFHVGCGPVNGKHTRWSDTVTLGPVELRYLDLYSHHHCPVALLIISAWGSGFSEQAQSNTLTSVIV